MAKKRSRKKAARGPNGLLALPARLGIKNVSEWKSELAGLLKADCSIKIDASAVESIDTAALQLLVAFVSQLKQQARALEWQQPTDAFLQHAHLIDVARHLGLEARADDDDLCPVF